MTNNKKTRIISCLLVVILLTFSLSIPIVAASAEIYGNSVGGYSNEPRTSYGFTFNVWHMTSFTTPVSLKVVINSMSGYAVYRIVPRVNGNLVNTSIYISYTTTGTKYINCYINGGGDFGSSWYVELGDFVDFLVYPYISTSLPVDQPSAGPLDVTFWKYTTSRTDIIYSDTNPYRDNMRYKMNCYGYALHLYYPEGNSVSPYKQQPGEFTYDTDSFDNLMRIRYDQALQNGTLNNFVRDRIYEDFATLSNYSSEFNITPTTLQASVPSEKRKIALVTAVDDYHFYIRHSDGSWSHKPATEPITNTAFTSFTIPLTDANIATYIQEGGYNTSAPQYFLIGKSGVVDYPHYYGHNGSTQYTANDFRDKAGDRITKSFDITNNWNSRFDYPGDRDYFKFTPTLSGTYTISTDCGSDYDIDGAIYDDNGNVIVQDYSLNNANFNVYLTANTTYYIYMTDSKQHTGYYTLLCYK